MGKRAKGKMYAPLSIPDVCIEPRALWEHEPPGHLQGIPLSET